MKFSLATVFTAACLVFSAVASPAPGEHDSYYKTVTVVKYKPKYTTTTCTVWKTAYPKPKYVYKTIYPKPKTVTCTETKTKVVYPDPKTKTVTCTETKTKTVTVDYKEKEKEHCEGPHCD